tara:strand:+ start:82 stop:636 length:555 start_codon:yes stop_codon:yes gene_type:complete
MLDPNHPISKLAREDGRYCVDAYTFVFDALNHAHTIIQQEVRDEAVATEEADSEAAEIDQLLLSEEIEIADTDVDEEIESLRKIASEEQGEAEETERHVTGQELCGAIRSLAVDQYGYMAKCVLNSWGVYRTGDFGNIVFNLIEIGQMKKTDRDKLEDFENVFDFDRELVQNFSIPRAGDQKSG